MTTKLAEVNRIFEVSYRIEGHAEWWQARIPAKSFADALAKSFVLGLNECDITQIVDSRQVLHAE